MINGSALLDVENKTRSFGETTFVQVTFHKFLIFLYYKNLPFSVGGRGEHGCLVCVDSHHHHLSSDLPGIVIH